MTASMYLTKDAVLATLQGAGLCGLLGALSGRCLLALYGGARLFVGALFRDAFNPFLHSLSHPRASRVLCLATLPLLCLATLLV